MSALTLIGTKSAIGLGNTASFLATGGIGPYTYSVNPNGQGGTINSSTGLYASPPWSNYNANPGNASDTITVTDSTTPTPLTATASILVGPPLILLMDILTKSIPLLPGRCTLYAQKLPQPSDPGLFVSVGIATVKIFANSSKFNPTTETFDNFVNSMAILDIHAISVDTSALFQKELVLAAMQSPYSIQQQEANAFSIGRIPAGGSINDITEIDGPALPYHYQFSIPLFYSVPASFSTAIFNTFQQPEVIVNQ
jgi:hypothetical protein